MENIRGMTDNEILHEFLQDEELYDDIVNAERSMSVIYAKMMQRIMDIEKIIDAELGLLRLNDGTWINIGVDK